MKTERLLASHCHRQNRLGHGVSPCRLLFTLLPRAVALLQPGLSRALQGTSAQSSCSSSAPALPSAFTGLFLTLLFSLPYCSWGVFCSFWTNAFPEAVPSWQRGSAEPCCGCLGAVWNRLWPLPGSSKHSSHRPPLQPLPVSGQLHSIKLLQEKAIIFWYFFSVIILNMVSWSLFVLTLREGVLNCGKFWLVP